MKIKLARHKIDTQAKMVNAMHTVMHAAIHKASVHHAKKMKNVRALGRSIKSANGDNCVNTF
jgi:hypothetical protein